MSLRAGRHLQSCNSATGRRSGACILKTKRLKGGGVIAGAPRRERLLQGLDTIFRIKFKAGKGEAALVEAGAVWRKGVRCPSGDITGRGRLCQLVLPDLFLNQKVFGKLCWRDALFCAESPPKIGI